jgi:CHC2 zinc finger
VTTDFDAWVQAARSVPIESVLTRRGVHLRKSGVERIGPCPKCGGTDRFSINVKEGVWNCRGCKPEGISGDVIGLVEWLDGVDFKTAVETLEGTRFNGGANGHANTNGHAFNNARPEQLGPIVAIYPYLDENARLLFQVTRHEPKDFRQRQPDGQGGWINHTRDVRMVPYRLPELIEAGALDRTIFILEGEKDVDNAVNLLGVPATTNPRGAGKWANCKIDQFFQNMNVVIVADNDPQTRNSKSGELLYHPDGRPRYAGFDHAQEVAQHLDPIAASVKVIDLKAVWPGCPEKGDLTDWIKAGGTAEMLNRIVEHTAIWTPGQQPAAALLILRLEDWLTRELPDPDCLLGSWLTTTTRGIGYWMACGKRGELHAPRTK